MFLQHLLLTIFQQFFPFLPVLEQESPISSRPCNLMRTTLVIKCIHCFNARRTQTLALKQVSNVRISETRTVYKVMVQPNNQYSVFIFDEVQTQYGPRLPMCCNLTKCRLDKCTVHPQTTPCSSNTQIGKCSPEIVSQPPSIHAACCVLHKGANKPLLV